MMKLNSLNKYAETLKKEGLLLYADFMGKDDYQPSQLSFDSREVGEGCLFICKGAAFKKEYLDAAVASGAACYISESELRDDVPRLIVNNMRRAMAVVSHLFYGHSEEAFKLVGLTGTKGKSTSTYYIKAIAEKALGGKRFGYISTIDTYDGVEEFESHLTTPEAPQLAKHFYHAKEAGLYGLVMEVSSQALKFDRSYGINFDIGCFMNFGIDHIGTNEHPTVEDYLQSKLLFFKQCRTCLLNIDSDQIEKIAAAAKEANLEKLICYSPSGKAEAEGLKAEYFARNVRKEGALTCFDIEKAGEGIILNIRLSMPGLFNVENALAASIISLELGFGKDAIEEGLLNATAPGRMELFENKDREIAIISDYAHNELSFEKLFSSIKEEFKGYRIEALFGCPGGKGYQRREALPRVAAKYSDFVWITEEDPGLEDPMEISKQVASELDKAGCPYEIIVDRELAIKTAIEKAAPKTVIVLAAKGREEYMKRGTEYVPVESDSALAEKYLGLKG